MKIDQQTFDNMQTDTPYKSYIKTIFGNVFVMIINSFSGEPEGIILHGNPRKFEKDSYVNVWNSIEDTYFRRANRRHLSNGTMREFVLPENHTEPVPEPYANASDEELKGIINGRYYSLTSALNKTTSEAVIGRFLILAQELEKSEKIVRVIKQRLSEVQSGELDTITVEE
jgi:hypothetical protein